MSNIRQVQWNDKAPQKIQPGMLIERWDGKIDLIGTCRISVMKPLIKRWAWLIQPHELNWLEDMASRKTRTQE